MGRKNVIILLERGLKAILIERGTSPQGITRDLCVGRLSQQPHFLGQQSWLEETALGKCFRSCSRYYLAHADESLTFE